MWERWKREAEGKLDLRSSGESLDSVNPLNIAGRNYYNMRGHKQPAVKVQPVKKNGKRPIIRGDQGRSQQGSV
jgi:hypothetical protein